MDTHDESNTNTARDVYDHHFEDGVAAAAALDLILDPRPSDYTNIIRRYSNVSPLSPPSASKTGGRKGTGPRGRSPSPSAKGRGGVSPSGSGQALSTSSRSYSRPWARATSSIARSIIGKKDESKADERGTSKDGAKKAAALPSSVSTGDLQQQHHQLQSAAEQQQQEQQQEQLRTLEEENAALRQRVATLETLQSVEAEDLDKLGRFRIRMLKAQNMQLEEEVVSLASCVSGVQNLRSEMLATLAEIRTKAAEFQAMEPLAEVNPEEQRKKVQAEEQLRQQQQSSDSTPAPQQRQQQPRRSLSPWSRGSTPSSSGERGGSRASPSPSRGAASPRGGSSSSFSSTQRVPLHTPRSQSPAARKGSPNPNGLTPPRSPESRRKRWDEEDRARADEGNIASAESDEGGKEGGGGFEPVVEAPQIPPGERRVAVRKDWLSDVERWSEGLERRLAQLNVGPEWAVLGKRGAGGGAAEGLVRAGGEDGRTASLAVGAAVPFVAAAGNRFIVKDEDDAPMAGLGVNMARILHGSLPLVQYAQVHELEGRLGDLHPRLLTLSSLLHSVIFPSLPAETSGAILQEILTALTDVQYAAHCVSELAALVPSGVQLRGFGPVSAASDLSRLRASEQQRKSVPSAEALAEVARAGADRGWGGVGGGGLSPTPGSNSPLGGGGAEWGGEHGWKQRGSILSEFPSAEELLRALPQLRSQEEEAVALRCLESTVEKLRNAEARWKAEMRAVQDEMAFYRGCHGAQASHVKQVLSAAREVLESILGDAFHVSKDAAQLLASVLQHLEQYQADPGDSSAIEQLLTVLEDAAPSLRQFVNLLPSDFNPSEVTQSMLEPLDREFKERMQAVFERLQSRRASLARQRSGGMRQGSDDRPAPQRQPSGKLMKTISLSGPVVV